MRPRECRNGTYRCTWCEHWLPEDAFNKKEGKALSRCAACTRQIFNARYNNRPLVKPEPPSDEPKPVERRSDLVCCVCGALCGPLDALLAHQGETCGARLLPFIRAIAPARRI